MTSAPVPSAGRLIAFGDSQSDYAVIHLSQPVLGAPVMAVTPGFADGTAMVDDVQAVAKDPALALLHGWRKALTLPPYEGEKRKAGPVRERPR